MRPDLIGARVKMCGGQNGRFLAARRRSLLGVFFGSLTRRVRGFFRNSDGYFLSFSSLPLTNCFEKLKVAAVDFGAAQPEKFRLARLPLPSQLIFLQA
jgi:hypothetical protein